MEDKEIRKKLENILTDQLKGVITEQHRKKGILSCDFTRDLGMDSLDMTEFFYYVEEDFKISMPEEGIEKLEKAEDYLPYIKQYLKD